MAYTLTFEVCHAYDAGAPGITVPVILSSGSLSRRVEAKHDSGSTYCIFRATSVKRSASTLKAGYGSGLLLRPALFSPTATKSRSQPPAFNLR